MLRISFIRPVGEIFFEPSFDDPSVPTDEPEAYAGIIDERFDAALRVDVRGRNMAGIPSHWLTATQGDDIQGLGGTIKLHHTDVSTSLELPPQCNFEHDDGRKTEPIIIPLHATTVIITVGMRSGEFACLGLVTSEEDQLRSNAPERLGLIISPCIDYGK